MATVQLADIYDPNRFASLTQEKQIEKNAFIQSGIMVADAGLVALCAQSGMGGEYDQIKPLDMSEPNYASDNSTDTKASDKLGTQQLKYRKAARTKQWSAMDIARGVGLNDPMVGIADRVGDYWSTDVQRRLINSMVGIYEDNKANYSSDMIVDVSNDASGAATADELANAKNFLDALALKGDMDNISGFAVHSSVYYGLRQLRQLVDTHDPITNTSFTTLEGKSIIFDDSLPAVMGSNRIAYTSILFGGGAVAYGEGNMPNTIASELFRNPNAGNGSGEDTLYSRRTDIIMPVGFSWENTAVAGLSATYAELQNAANWTRVWDPKNIPVSFLVSNG